mmetsp:Transcript_18847/g.58640  ORF Transcript_18847/g.58640 Transcript_18847/m.58640 type:complete len:244 (-) Transcript_18847:1976-2707(-)
MCAALRRQVLRGASRRSLGPVSPSPGKIVATGTAGSSPAAASISPSATFPSMAISRCPLLILPGRVGCRRRRARLQPTDDSQGRSAQVKICTSEDRMHDDNTSKYTAYISYVSGSTSGSSTKDCTARRRAFLPPRGRPRASTAGAATSCWMSLKPPVPTGAGMPMMMHSDTPSTLSTRPCSAASKRWSVVFSKDASMSTDSFILAMPKRVMPSTSPLYVITSARSIECRLSIDMPCEPIVNSI